jgi:hypothetical protein
LGFIYPKTNKTLDIKEAIPYLIDCRRSYQNFVKRSGEIISGASTKGIVPVLPFQRPTIYLRKIR